MYNQSIGLIILVMLQIFKCETKTNKQANQKNPQNFKNVAKLIESSQVIFKRLIWQLRHGQIYLYYKSVQQT